MSKTILDKRKTLKQQIEDLKKQEEFSKKLIFEESKKQEGMIKKSIKEKKRIEKELKNKREFKKKKKLKNSRVEKERMKMLKEEKKIKESEKMKDIQEKKRIEKELKFKRKLENEKKVILRIKKERDEKEKMKLLMEEKKRVENEKRKSFKEKKRMEKELKFKKKLEKEKMVINKIKKEKKEKERLKLLKEKTKKKEDEKRRTIQEKKRIEKELKLKKKLENEKKVFIKMEKEKKEKEKLKLLKEESKKKEDEKIKIIKEKKRMEKELKHKKKLENEKKVFIKKEKEKREEKEKLKLLKEEIKKREDERRKNIQEKKRIEKELKLKRKFENERKAFIKMEKEREERRILDNERLRIFNDDMERKRLIVQKLNTKKSKRKKYESTPKQFTKGKNEINILIEDIKYYFILYKEKGIMLYDLVCDIGGTNTRIVFKPLNSTEMRLKVMFECNTCDFLLKKFIFISNQAKKVYGNKRIVDYCVLSVAGTVENHKIDNIILGSYLVHSKSFRRKILPINIFPYQNTYVLNDIEASCYSIIHFGKSEMLQRFFHKKNYFSIGNFIGNQPRNDVSSVLHFRKCSYFVINVGTGFGSSIIRYSDTLKDYEVIPLGFGGTKAVFSPNEDENSLLKQVSKINFEKFSNPNVFFTDVCSGGKGILNIKNSLTRSDTGFDDPIVMDKKLIPDIVKDDERVLLYFLKFLFNSSQSICVSFPKLKGIFFCGNNFDRNKEFLYRSDIRSLLTNTFYDCRRKEKVLNVKGYVQKVKYNHNLHGGFCYLRNLKNKKNLKM